MGDKKVLEAGARLGKGPEEAAGLTLPEELRSLTGH